MVVYMVVYIEAGWRIFEAVWDGKSLWWTGGGDNAMTDRPYCLNCLDLAGFIPLWSLRG